MNLFSIKPLRRRINRTLGWGRDAFLIIGILTLSYAGYVLIDTQLYQADQTRQFEAALKSAPRAPAESLAIAGHEGSRVGRIEINQIGLTAMILEGVSKTTLRRAVGHIQGTALPGQRGNVALAGHRDTFFRELRMIRPNHEITLTTLTGIYRYRVESTIVVAPEATEVLAPGPDDILTLVTCYPFDFIGSAPRRFIVRARKIPA